MINAGYSSMHESSTIHKNYYKVEKYNDIITNIYTDKQNHSLSSRLKKALDNSYKKGMINGYLSSPGKYQVQHDKSLSIDKLIDLLTDYTGDGELVRDDYRPNDIVKVVL